MLRLALIVAVVFEVALLVVTRHSGPSIIVKLLMFPTAVVVVACVLYIKHGRNVHWW